MRTARSPRAWAVARRRAKSATVAGSRATRVMAPPRLRSSTAASRSTPPMSEIQAPRTRFTWPSRRSAGVGGRRHDREWAWHGPGSGRGRGSVWRGRCTNRCGLPQNHDMRVSMKRPILLLPLLIAGVAVATGDPRGWSEGQPAANAAAFMTQPALGEIELPKSLLKTLKKKSVLVYFSPTCPHCRHVAPELGRMADKLGNDAELVMIASSSSTDAALTEWKATFGGKYRIVKDGDRAIGTAMGIRSTPSALVVEPASNGKVKVLDAYYPFSPGYSALVEMRLGETPFASFEKGEYQGTAVCAACHTQEAEAWAITHHSMAWRTLVLDEEHENAECTGCHVTGNGQPGGWDGDPGSHLTSVGCEACHGPSGPHDGT
ncbi:MAG: redoxin domain-containing protein, partial [Deltaproteobacteria bacterium]